MHDNKSSFWWDSKRNEVHEQIHQHIRKLQDDQGYRAEDNLRYLRLYGNQETLGLGLYNYSKVAASKSPNRVTLNVIQSMTDTVVSKITKNQPLPMYLTDGGDWSEQRKAKKLNQFTQGQFHAHKVYELGPQVFRDACVFGTGALKIFRKKGRICVERVFTNEIIVDDTEAMYGSPRTMHQVKWIHREVLKKMFPKFKKQIEDAEQELTDRPFSTSREPHMIQVCESWRLPTDKEAGDGRHTISISNATLVDEEYKRDYFPFVFFRWTPRLLGFFGQGLAEQLQGLQVEINKILRIIQIGMHLVSIPRVLVEHGSKVKPEHINNKIGAMVKYTGQPPTFWNASGALPQELFSHLDRLYQRAFEIAGISQLSAQSKKPSGLDSGKALRTFNDIESERFLDVGRRYEDFYMEVARQLLEVAREIDADDTVEGDYKVTVPGKKFIKTIKLSECDMDEDRYIMQKYPISAFSTHPASRMQEIAEAVSLGVITPQQSRRLLDFPDLQAELQAELANEEYVDYVLDQILDHNNALQPEPFADLQAATAKMQKTYLQLITQNAPEKKMDMIRQWIVDAQAELKAAEEAAMQEQMQAQMAAMGGAPMDPTMQDPAMADPAMDPAMADLPPEALEGLV